MFGDLFGSGRGRPSTPGSVVATVMVLQALECLSDREAVQRLRRDIAWNRSSGFVADRLWVSPDGADLLAGEAACE